MNSEEHASRVRGMPCMVCGCAAEVHHGIGRAVSRRAGIGVRGRSKNSDWLTMPLCTEHHTGPTGIHALGDYEFAAMHWAGQVEMIDRVGRFLGVDPWAMAEIEYEQDRAARRYQPPVKRIKPDAGPDPLTLYRMKSAPKTKLGKKLPAGRNNKRPAKVLERT